MVVLIGIATAEGSVFRHLIFPVAYVLVQGFFCCALLFQFRRLKSEEAILPFWYNLSRVVEWIMAILITIVLPLPTIMFSIAAIAILLKI